MIVVALGLLISLTTAAAIGLVAIANLLAAIELVQGWRANRR